MAPMPELAEITEVQRSPDEPATHDRASFIRWLGQMGIGAVAATATFLADRSRSGASSGTAGAPSHGYHEACCHLANPHDPSCNCGGGGRPRYWTCCSGTQLYQCMECEDPRYPPAESCWKGYFSCSEVTRVPVRC